jgi:alkanesulfonate monooxygenase SsuD/methylene tetrahydromethanopterin reductase-like flavin-dependent oxidoreductase (luciferase family)
VEIVKLLWTSNDEIDYQGRYYRLNGAYLAPKPLSKPHPPIWFGGFSDRILDLIAAYGNGWINATNARPDDVKVQTARLNALLAAKGRKLKEIDVAVPFLTIVREREEEAKKVAELYMSRGKFDKTLRFFADTLAYGLVGTPEQCVKRIRQYALLGVGHVIFDVRPPSNTLSTLELLDKRVIPQLV